MASVGAKKRAKQARVGDRIERLRESANAHVSAEAKYLEMNRVHAADLADLSDRAPALYERALFDAAKKQGAINCVYFIRMGDTDAVKIGKAFNGVKRLMSHQTSSPVDLNMEAFVNFTGVYEMENGEAAAHEAARDSHLRGEWFRLSVADVRRAAITLALGRKDHVIGAFWKEAA